MDAPSLPAKPAAASSALKPAATAVAARVLSLEQLEDAGFIIDHGLFHTRECCPVMLYERYGPRSVNAMHKCGKPLGSGESFKRGICSQCNNKYLRVVAIAGTDFARRKQLASVLRAKYAEAKIKRDVAEKLERSTKSILHVKKTDEEAVRAMERQRRDPKTAEANAYLEELEKSEEFAHEFSDMNV